ncbi:hypothetical protein P7K49_016082 [Saguinus oedipus]|uniref:Uncharacterized protein n=1 Tax=Saguinus oedipus TaxID=9490 RepID=A0ABQ9VD28_SAGOE|nr:hypothetical protein P7K49_016082 [Saguinus oedipus]
MSSEAETQQPPAAPPAAPALSAADTKPGTTGSGAGSGGPGGLTSAAPAGGDKKVIGEGRTGTGGEPAGARPAGTDSAARGRPSPSTPTHPHGGPPGRRARSASRAPCRPRADARPSPCGRAPANRVCDGVPSPPTGLVRSGLHAVVRVSPTQLPSACALRARRTAYAGRSGSGRLPLPSRALRPRPAHTPILGPRPGPALERPAASDSPTCAAATAAWPGTREVERKGCQVASRAANEGFGNSKMVQCKERIWFHQQVSSRALKPLHPTVSHVACSVGFSALGKPRRAFTTSGYKFDLLAKTTSRCFDWTAQRGRVVKHGERAGVASLSLDGLGHEKQMLEFMMPGVSDLNALLEQNALHSSGWAKWSWQD